MTPTTSEVQLNNQTGFSNVFSNLLLQVNFS
jgi:hypothetical protein